MNELEIAIAEKLQNIMNNKIDQIIDNYIYMNINSLKSNLDESISYRIDHHLIKESILLLILKLK